MRVRRLKLWIYLCLGCGVAEVDAKQLIGYYANWTVERGCPVTGILAQAADVLDVVVYAFLDIDVTTGRVRLSDPAVDVGYGTSWSAGNFSQLMWLKSQHPLLKIVLSVGGWSYREKFKQIVDAGLTAKFVQSCIDILTHTTVRGTRYTYAGLFDGIDLDWEFDDGDPVGYASAYVTLVRQLRAAITASGIDYSLSVALQANEAMYQGKNAIAVATLAGLVDWINVMAYDFNGTWQKTTNFAAPLYARTRQDQCVDTAVRGLLAKHVPAHKMVLGISLVGNTYRGVAQGTTCGLGQKTTGPATGSILGKYEAGKIYYRDIAKYLTCCSTCGRAGYGYCWQPVQYASWLYNARAHVFVSYESPASVRAKARYARNRLGGMACWELCADTSGAALTHMIREVFDAL